MKRKLLLLMFFALSACGSPSATPAPTPDLSTIQTAAFEKAWSSYTQAAAAMPTLTSTSTQTFTPLPTNTALPTFHPTRTATLIPFPTATLVVFILPTSPPSQGSCSCGGDTYNCSDFSSRSSAQACYNACVAAGRGDIHRLDQDNDGDACESL